MCEEISFDGLSGFLYTGINKKPALLRKLAAV
jgi:hypothetical protein